MEIGLLFQRVLSSALLLLFLVLPIFLYAQDNTQESLTARSFVYPVNDGQKVLDEHLDPENNPYYPNNPVRSSEINRETTSTGSFWFNFQDVGVFNSDLGGIHAGEDWNFGGVGDDIDSVVYAAANGRVEDVRSLSTPSSGSGYAITLKHTLPGGKIYYSLYLHVVDKSSENGDIKRPNLEKGDSVEKGEPIAKIGNITNFGSHLHFEIRDQNWNPNPNGDLHPNDIGTSAYYSHDGTAASEMSSTEVQEAYDIMRSNGIIDPSDFIDNHSEVASEVDDLIIDRSFSDNDTPAIVVNIENKEKNSDGSLTANLELKNTYDVWYKVYIALNGGATFVDDVPTFSDEDGYYVLLGPRLNGSKIIGSLPQITFSKDNSSVAFLADQTKEAGPEPQLLKVLSAFKALAGVDNLSVLDYQKLLDASKSSLTIERLKNFTELGLGSAFSLYWDYLTEDIQSLIETFKVIGHDFSADQILSSANIFAGIGSVSSILVNSFVSPYTDQLVIRGIDTAGTTALKGKSNSSSDNVSPAAPNNLSASPSQLTRVQNFWFSWDNPTDNSGFNAVWYKIGSPPRFASNGTRLPLPNNKPFPATVTPSGKTDVYVWLEDGAGNKGYQNSASVVVERDDTLPEVTIQEPVENPSNEYVHETTNGILNLEGTMSDTQSEIISVLWINSRGGSGFGEFSGSNWTLNDIPLFEGANAIGALALDAAGNIGYDILGVQYNAPEENFTLEVSATNGSVEKDPNKNSFAPGSEVELTAEPDNGFKFDQWEGDASGDENPLTVTMDEDKDITASFVEDGDSGGEDDEDETEGSITTTIRPPEVVSAGAQWRVDGKSDWKNSGETVSGLPLLGSSTTYTVEFRTIEDWTTPDPIDVRLRPEDPSKQVNSAPYTRPTAITSGFLTASNGVEDDNFGSTLDLNGDFAVIGADDRAYMFKDQGDSWIQSQELYRPEDPQNFGNSIAIGGRFVVVSEEGRDADKGVVRTYEKFGDEWLEDETLAASDRQEDDLFGRSVDTDGDVIVVGAPLEDEVADRAGAAYIFRRQSYGGSFKEEQKLLPSDGIANGNFGIHTAVNGDVAVISASRYSGGQDALYVFRYKSSGWIEEVKLSPSDDSGFASRAGSIDVQGDYIIVGAPFATVDGKKSVGLVYVYHYNGTKWIEETRLTTPGMEESDNFGYSVSIDGDMIVVGTSEDDKGSGSGSAHIFHRVKSKWVHSKKILPDALVTSDRFGRAVAASGSKALIGVPNDDVNGVEDQGSAYIFEDLQPRAANGVNLAIQSAPNTPIEVSAGGTVTITTIVENFGDSVIEQEWEFGFYLVSQENTCKNVSSQPLATEMFNSSTEFPVESKQNITISSDKPVGEYKLCAVIDEANNIEETNEDDNYAAIPLTVIETQDNVAPVAPTGFNANQTGKNIELEWNASDEDDLAGYNLYRGVEASSLTLLTNFGESETTYIDTEVEREKTYYYAITAVDSVENESPQSEVISIKVTDAPPATPINFILKTDSKAILSWQSNSESDLAGYLIYSGKDANSLSVIDSLGSNATSYSITSNSTGFYAISAIDSNGNESPLSPWVSYLKDQLNISNQWQLMSNPAIEEKEIGDANAFGFDGTYTEDSVLTAGKGYWVKSEQDQTVPLQDQGLDSTDIQLAEGWNLIGSLVDTLSKSAISDPDGIIGSPPAYGYNVENNTYEKITEFLPKQGYWLYADKPGPITLHFNKESSSQTKANNPQPENIEYDRLIFSNKTAEQELLYFYGSLQEEVRQQYLLPPMAPVTVMDVRTPKGYKAIDAASNDLRLTAQTYPVQIQMEGPSQGAFVYRFTAGDGEGKKRMVLTSGSPVLVDKEYETIQVERLSGEDIITENDLAPNFPNPFSSTTTIIYEIVETSQVTLEVYNVIGQRVKTLVDAEQSTGEYTEVFEASNLASGVYIIRLKIDDEIRDQKITLIK